MSKNKQHWHAKQAAQLQYKPEEGAMQRAQALARLPHARVMDTRVVDPYKPKENTYKDDQQTKKTLQSKIL